MALAIDASSPSLATANTGNVATTASFTPPAGAVLCAVAWHDTTGGNTTNTSLVTDSSTLIWTIQATRNKADAGGQNGHVQVSTAVATGAAITVTTTGSSTGGSFAAGLYVLVMTGCDTTTPIDVITEGSNTGGVASLTFSTVTDLAWAFLANGDWNVAAAPTAGASQTAIVSGGIGAGPDNRIYLGRQNAVTSPAGSVTVSTATPVAANTNNSIGWAFRPSAAVTASATPMPVVVSPTTRPPRTTAVVLRGSLADDPVLTTPAPIVSTVPGRRGVPGTRLLRSTLADDPVLTTAAPIVVAAPIRQRVATVWLGRSSLEDIVVVTAATPGPVVVGQQPRPRPGAVTVLRSTLVDDPVLTTPQPITVAPPTRPRPGVVALARGSLIDLATAQPLVVVSPAGRRAAPVLVLRNPAGPDDAPGVQPLVITAPRRQHRATVVTLRTFDSSPPPPTPAGPGIHFTASLAESRWTVLLADSRWRTDLDRSHWTVGEV